MAEKPTVFEGTVVQRGRQPGIFLPTGTFKCATKTESATLAQVEMLSDHTKNFIRRVARVNKGQCIVHIPRDKQDEFVAGTRCEVCVWVARVL